MATRYDLGAIILNKIDEEAFAKITSKLNDIAPDFADHLIENFGDNYSRPHLNTQERELVAIASMVSLGRFNCLETHVLGAIKIGIPIKAIIEVMVQLSFYVGFPTAVAGLLKLKEILKAENFVD